MILSCVFKIIEAIEAPYHVFTYKGQIEKVLFYSTETTFILPGMAVFNRYRESCIFLYELKK